MLDKLQSWKKNSIFLWKDLTIPLKKRVKFWRAKYQLWKNMNEKYRNGEKLEQYSRLEFIEIASILSSITNDLYREHILLIFQKLDVVLEGMDIATCHRLAKMNRVIVKLLNWKDSKYIIEQKYKLRNIVLYDHGESENSNRSRKIFIAITIENFMVW